MCLIVFYSRTPLVLSILGAEGRTSATLGGGAARQLTLEAPGVQAAKDWLHHVRDQVVEARVRDLGGELEAGCPKKRQHLGCGIQGGSVNKIQ